MLKRHIKRARINRLVSSIERSNSYKQKFQLRSKFIDWNRSLPIPYAADKGETVAQCGCWRIETVLQWVNAVGPKGTVVVIEADDVNCMILEIEKKRRLLDNVIIVNKAIYDSQTQVPFLFSEFTPRNKIKTLPTYGTAKPIEQDVKTVDADTMDNIFASVGIDSVDHIHFTISGAELEALNGIHAILKPGLRIFARSTCLHEEDNRPVRERVVEKMQDLGFTTVLAKPEVDRNMGGNIYGIL